MSDTKFSVSWNAYQKNICSGLSFLQQRGEFVDMTIAADGHLVKVHQMVMSLVSPFIKELIASAQCPHPVIFLNKVSYKTLQVVLEYAYTGEALVTQECLNEFLEVCNTLHIKGLENMGKTIKPEDYSSYQDDDKEQALENNRSATIDLSQLSMNVADNSDDCMQTEDSGADDNIDHEKTDENFSEEKVKESDSHHKGKTAMQYSMSNQGSLQLILNRYIYSLRYKRKDNTKLWRCYQFNRKSCPACVLTKGDVVLERNGAHNHSFHDAQILKRVRNNNLFTVEPKDHHMAAKRLCSKADNIRTLFE